MMSCSDHIADGDVNAWTALLTVTGRVCVSQSCMLGLCSAGVRVSALDSWLYIWLIC